VLSLLSLSLTIFRFTRTDPHPQIVLWSIHFLDPTSLFKYAVTSTRSWDNASHTILWSNFCAFPRRRLHFKETVFRSVQANENKLFCCHGNKIDVVDATTGRSMDSGKLCPRGATSFNTITYCERTNRVFAADSDGQLFVFDAATMEVKEKISDFWVGQTPIWHIFLFESTLYMSYASGHILGIATRSEDDTLMKRQRSIDVYDKDVLAILNKEVDLDPHRVDIAQVEPSIFSSTVVTFFGADDTRLLVCGDDAGYLSFWELNSLHDVEECYANRTLRRQSPSLSFFTGINDAIRCVVSRCVTRKFSHVICCGEMSGTICGWRVDRRTAFSDSIEPVFKLDAHEGAVHTISLLSSATMYTASEDNCVKMWRRSDAEGKVWTCQRTLQRHEADITCIVPIRTSKGHLERLWTGSYDHTMVSWEPPSPYYNEL